MLKKLKSQRLVPLGESSQRNYADLRKKLMREPIKMSNLWSLKKQRKKLTGVKISYKL